MPLQTLITGFGPFGSVVDNPTERLLRHLEAQDVAGHDLTVCALPTSFARAPQAFKAAFETGGRGGQPFDLILMLGVAARSPAWRVESQGLNQDAPAIPDVDGFTPPHREIVPGGAAHLPVTLPPQILLLAVESLGLPVTLSDSAGQYLCNHLLYTALDLARRSHPIPRTGFLHVPPDEHTFGVQGVSLSGGHIFSFAQHVEVVSAILEACALLPSALPDAQPEAVASFF